ncbi:MAG: hypothetical protein ACI9BD_001119 [Candidatus Marinamargulisbacteria bacterium]
MQKKQIPMQRQEKGFPQMTMNYFDYEAHLGGTIASDFDPGLGVAFNTLKSTRIQTETSTIVVEGTGDSSQLSLQDIVNLVRKHIIVGNTTLFTCAIFPPNHPESDADRNKQAANLLAGTLKRDRVAPQSHLVVAGDQAFDARTLRKVSNGNSYLQGDIVAHFSDTQGEWLIDTPAFFSKLEKDRPFSLITCGTDTLEITCKFAHLAIEDISLFDLVGSSSGRPDISVSYLLNDRDLAYLRDNLANQTPDIRLISDPHSLLSTQDIEAFSASPIPTFLISHHVPHVNENLCAIGPDHAILSTQSLLRLFGRKNKVSQKLMSTLLKSVFKSHSLTGASLVPVLALPYSGCLTVHGTQSDFSPAILATKAHLEEGEFLHLIGVGNGNVFLPRWREVEKIMKMHKVFEMIKEIRGHIDDNGLETPLSEDLHLKQAQLRSLFQGIDRVLNAIIETLNEGIRVEIGTAVQNGLARKPFSYEPGLLLQVLGCQPSQLSLPNAPFSERLLNSPLLSAL